MFFTFYKQANRFWECRLSDKNFADFDALPTNMHMTSGQYIILTCWILIGYFKLHAIALISIKEKY